MDLIRDVLDQQIIDSRKCKAGKVDGIAMEIRENGPPRVAYLDVGTDVLARRLSQPIQRIVERLRRRVRPGKPFQIPWPQVEHVGISVKVRVDATQYSSQHLENWLRQHIIGKIPGNAHRKHQEKND